MTTMMNVTAILGAMDAAQAEQVKAALELLQTVFGAGQPVVAPKETHWEPTEGEKYYFMWDTGKTDEGVFSPDNQKDLMRLAVGNYFKTEEERDAAIEYLKVVAELKAFAFDNNDPIDWDNHDERKYKLCFNRETGCVDTTWSRRKITDGIYFSSHDVAMAAVAAVGEDRIKAFYLPDAE